jgi:hypothetical protein
VSICIRCVTLVPDGRPGLRKHREADFVFPTVPEVKDSGIYPVSFLPIRARDHRVGRALMRDSTEVENCRPVGHHERMIRKMSGHRDHDAAGS